MRRCHLRVLSSLLVLLPLSGCGLLGIFGSKSEEIPEPPPRIVQSLPAPKPVTREPGSLWSEDSKWNTIFTAAPAHSLGDIVTVKFDPAMKEKVISMTDVQLPPREEDKDKKEKEQKAAKKTKKKKTVATNPENANNPGATEPLGPDGKPLPKKVEYLTVDATIIEILPNGMYRIAGDRALKLTPEEPYVTFEGQIRERDLENDSITADRILNLNVNLTSMLPPASVAGKNSNGQNVAQKDSQ